MIVLGPMDADLNGAPPYWRSGNWRPNTPPILSTPCAFTTCPFDKCDLVFEYDARIQKRPMPDEQGWSQQGSAGTFWKHEPERGALKFFIPENEQSFWSFGAAIDPPPGRAVGYGLFLVESGKLDTRGGGLEFVTQAAPAEGRYRGMRGSWAGGWTYRRLDNGAPIPMVQPTAVQSLSDVWHRMALDAELTGPNVKAEDVEENDGGQTIGSLDGILNNDPRRLFGYGDNAKSEALALFGKIDEKGGSIQGWIRNYCASYPGRFMRAGFRAVALGKKTVLRFVFCADIDPKAEPDTAVFLVRYASPSLGLNATSLPSVDAPLAVGNFEAGKIVELSVELDRLVSGEELWFTIERDWQNEKDRLRATVHLLMVIVEEARG